MTFTRKIIHTLFLLITLTLLAGVSLAQNPEGDPNGFRNRIHDQQAGSMLIYNYYTSTTYAGGPNMRISMTNTNPTTAVFMQLYFVEGSTGHTVPNGLELAPNQTVTFLTSDADPNNTGYIIAQALDPYGSSMQFNYLMGVATIKLASGHLASLGALGVPMNANGSYAALPRELAMDQVPSPLDDAKRLLIINRIDGDWMSGISPIAALQSDVFDDHYVRGRYVSSNQGPQAAIFASNLITNPNPGNYYRVGRYGWLRLRPVGVGAITGAVLFFNRNPSTGVTSPALGSYNLRHLTNTQATVNSYSGGLLFGY